MRYKEDWERAKTKYLEYWNMENHDRPIISVVAPKDGYIPSNNLKTPTLLEKWTDMDYIIKAGREALSATYFGGEAFPMLWPNLGPDIFGAFVGCDLEFGEDTSWSHPIIKEWGSALEIKFDPNNKWWKKIVQMTEALVEDSKGDYLVGITDLHPGIDGVVSLRSPQATCMDLYDNHDSIKKTVMDLFEVYKVVLDELYRISTKNQEGTSNWMGIWHPGKWYVTSADFICMISGEMFTEFVLPGLMEELRLLDASVFHLDGPGALKHLDTLLEIPELKGIQWVYGAGQPTASHWIPVLKKIQAAGKLIQVHILPDELDVLMENLRPEGVMFLTSCESEEEARRLIKKADEFYR